MQGQRYLVEKGFKEGKKQVGLDDYKVRSWQGFHHHMAISCLALNFIMEKKVKARKLMPHISAEDIRSLNEFLLPERIIAIEEKIDEMFKKQQHYQRQIRQRLKLPPS